MSRTQGNILPETDDREQNLPTGQESESTLEDQFRTEPSTSSRRNPPRQGRPSEGSLNEKALAQRQQEASKRKTDQQKTTKQIFKRLKPRK